MLSIYPEREIRLIVGLGGGSSMDTAKAAAIMGTRQGSFGKYAEWIIVPKEEFRKSSYPPLEAQS